MTIDPLNLIGIVLLVLGVIAFSAYVIRDMNNIPPSPWETRDRR